MYSILRLIYIIILLIIIYQISIYLCDVIYNEHFNECNLFIKIAFVMVIFIISQCHYNSYTKNYIK